MEVKSFMFSVLLWFFPEVNPVWGLQVALCAAVMLFESLQLGLGKADIFQLKLDLFWDVCLPVHNRTGTFLL